MNWLKPFKYILLLLGFITWGIPGAFFGFLFGAYYDLEAYRERIPYHPGDFTTVFLLLATRVISANGYIKHNEIRYVTEYLNKHVHPAYVEAQLQIFKSYINQEFELEPICERIAYHYDSADRRQLLYLLYGIAAADGTLQSAERTLLQHIAEWIDLGLEELNRIEAMFMASKRPPQSPPANSDYDILGVDPSASNEVVKKSFQKLALKYHPDKVAHLGEAYQKSAREKFEILIAAYSRIKLSRGMD